MENAFPFLNPRSSFTLFFLAVLVGIAYTGMGVVFVNIGIESDKPLIISLGISFVLVGLGLTVGGYLKLRDQM